MTREEFVKGIQEALGMKRWTMTDALAKASPTGAITVFVEIVPTPKQRKAIAKVVSDSIIGTPEEG